MIINTKTLVGEIFSQRFGLYKYEKIMKNVKLSNVSIDKEFQKNFNHYYQVRRDEAWRKTYYELFEDIKNESDLQFKDIITCLHKKTGNVEASFSSKLLATINPDMPIWDQHVLNNLSLKLKGKTKDEKLLNAINLYNEMIILYKEYLKTDNAKESVNLFKSLVPNFQWLTDTKIIDYLIFSIRDTKEK